MHEKYVFKLGKLWRCENLDTVDNLVGNVEASAGIFQLSQERKKKEFFQISFANLEFQIFILKFDLL